jgi:N-acetylneuraminic acid mutarotase
MNVARAYATATLLETGQVLIAGGVDATGTYLSSVELYDPSSNSFIPAASTPVMNVAREGTAAALLADGKVMIAGGYNGGYLASSEIYDPVSNTFADAVATPSMNVGRAWATATVLPNGKVLVAGGQNQTAGPLSTTELYTP